MLDAVTEQNITKANDPEPERPVWGRADVGQAELESSTWRPKSSVRVTQADFGVGAAAADEEAGALPPQAEAAESSAVGVSILKRLFDIVVALAALLFVAPLLILAGAAIWAESGKPIFFRQQRTGYRGRTFVILKLRTMRVLEDGDGVRQATRGDARITRVGAFLRKSSIDELPQIINVLKGDMSLVGPRPHALAHDELYGAELPSYHLRFQARPGLTGLAQIRGFRGEIHAIEDMAHRVEADIEYIRRWSLTQDVQIMLRTVPLLFHDAQAY